MKRILFVDRRNTARSQMAEAWFNQFAAGWAKAHSCGTMPARTMDAVTLMVMAEAGVNLRGVQPKPIDPALRAQADILVVMGTDVEAAAFQPDYIWDFQDPTDKQPIHYRIQRDAIRCRVQELIAELQRTRYNAEHYDWIHPAMLQRELLTQDMLRS